jgi:hypothetical protein
MKALLTFVLVLLSGLTLCQKIDYSTDLLNQIENPKDQTDYLHNPNYINEFNHYDFSTLFVPRLEFLGYIGTDFKRLRIFFTSISKDTVNPNIYKLSGISVVDKVKCDFKGAITIFQVRKLKTIHFGLDNIMKNKIKAQGLLLAKYEFKEDPSQKHSGIFQGNMLLRWYTDNLDIVHYDEIGSYSDSYSNLQFAGTWEDNTNGTKKTCNWGDRRIPFSGDLDIGVGEFSPNPKYIGKGWEDLTIR